jgi:CheY-like chemotaxis protein
MRPDLLKRLVLVIDGHEHSREAIADRLRLWGYLPFGVGSGAQALEYLEMGLEPCAILLDVFTCEDAWQFRTAQLRSRRWRIIPLVVGVALGQRPEAMAEELDVPPDHCVSRPLDLDGLARLLEHYCRRSTSTRDISRAV